MEFVIGHLKNPCLSKKKVGQPSVRVIITYKAVKRNIFLLYSKKSIDKSFSIWYPLQNLFEGGLGMKRFYQFENSAKSAFGMNPDYFAVPPYSEA